MSVFKDNLKQMPPVSHLSALELHDANGQVERIENKEGSQGSLMLYHHLAQTFGKITPDAARKGLELYGEHTEDARAFPGKHPNIDRLIRLVESQGELIVKMIGTV